MVHVTFGRMPLYNVKRMRRQGRDWGKIHAKATSDKVLLFKIHKTLKKLINKKINCIIKKWAKNFDRNFTK